MASLLSPAGSLIYSNSRVHGNRTLYAEAGSYHYELLLLNCMVPGFLPRREVEEGNSEALLLLIITTYYYTMLQQLLLHCYYIHVIELLVVSLLMLQDTSEDASPR